MYAAIDWLGLANSFGLLIIGVFFGLLLASIASDAAGGDGPSGGCAM